MTERESEDAIRRKRLLYRAGHRGMKEMDLILGRFAEERLPKMSEPELAEFEAIIDYPDISLYRWITGQDPVPPRFDGPLLRALCKAG